MTKGSKCKQRCSELGVQFNEALKAATTQVPIVTSAKVAVHEDTWRLQYDLEGLHVLLILFGIGLVIWVGAQAMWSVEFHVFLMGGTVLFAIYMESCIVGRRSE